MEALIQKMCIFLICMAPTVVVSYWAYQDVGPAVNGTAFLALFISTATLSLSMYCTQKWWSAWDRM